MRAGFGGALDLVPMDSAIEPVARALAAGKPLAAVGLVVLREDAPGLALRGIAMVGGCRLRRAAGERL